MCSARFVWFLTHPQVHIEPTVPVPQWRLSDLGRERAQRLAGRSFLATATSVWSSQERKAMETADLFAGDVARRVRADLGENDRSATGFVPPEEFESLAATFFAEPESSVRGWARAVDEQVRIVAAVTSVLADPAAGTGDVVVVAHGGVGTLLLCHLLKHPIDRALDQSAQGHFFSFDRDTLVVHQRWRPLEDLP